MSDDYLKLLTDAVMDRLNGDLSTACAKLSRFAKHWNIDLPRIDPRTTNLAEYFDNCAEIVHKRMRALRPDCF
jgi:hypothetical protein